MYGRYNDILDKSYKKFIDQEYKGYFIRVRKDGTGYKAYTHTLGGLTYDDDIERGAVMGLINKIDMEESFRKGFEQIKKEKEEQNID